MLFYFILADLEESQGNKEKAKSIYDDLVQSLERAGSDDSSPFSGSVTPDLSSLVWITYMRFLRRAFSTKASREVRFPHRLPNEACLQLFIGVSKSSNCPWQVYVAAAMLELRSKEQQATVRIFERGMLKFLGCPEFVLEYVNFLLGSILVATPRCTLFTGIGDIDNTRAVFERALSVESGSRSESLWNKYISCLYEIGDLSAAKDVEARKRAIMGDSTVCDLQSMMARYKLWEIWPFASNVYMDHVKTLLGLSVTKPVLPAIQPPPPGEKRFMDVIKTLFSSKCTT